MVSLSSTENTDGWGGGPREGSHLFITVPLLCHSTLQEDIHFPEDFPECKSGMQVTKDIFNSCYTSYTLSSVNFCEAMYKVEVVHIIVRRREV